MLTLRGDMDTQERTEAESVSKMSQCVLGNAAARQERKMIINKIRIQKKIDSIGRSIVAQTAGLSYGSISNYLNGYSKLPEGAEEKLVSAVKKLEKQKKNVH